MKRHLYQLGLSLIFSIACLVFSSSSLKAQLNCEFTCDSIFARFDASHLVGTGGLFYPIKLKYKSSVRKCNDIIEIKFDSMSITDYTSGSLDSLILYENNKTLVSNLFNITAIRQMNDMYGSLTPLCPDSIKYIKIYTAICGVWLKCRYKIDTNSRMCDEGFATPFPDFFVDGNKYVDIWRWQPCGEVCCQKSYDVCKVVNPSNGKWFIKIKQVKTQRHTQQSDCTLQGVFRDGITNDIIPCQDGC